MLNYQRVTSDSQRLWKDMVILILHQLCQGPRLTSSWERHIHMIHMSAERVADAGRNGQLPALKKLQKYRNPLKR